MGAGSSTRAPQNDVDAVVAACAECDDHVLLLRVVGASTARVLPRGPALAQAWRALPYQGAVDVQLATEDTRKRGYGHDRDVVAAETVRIEGLAEPSDNGWGAPREFRTTDGVIVARLATPAAVLAPRKLFLVRHAESTWNRATRLGDVATMLGDVDHGLTKLGAGQCAELQRRVAAPPVSDAERAFGSAGVVFSSPSRRTVQTALLGLSGHPALVKMPVFLRAELREVRTAHGRDNVARVSGVAVRSQALAGLVEGEYPAVDSSAVQHRWWASSAEDAQVVARRVDRALAQLALRPKSSAIFVSHSKFIRCMFRAEGGEDCSFARGKVANCGVVAVDVAFDAPAGSRLVDPELLFGATFSTVDSRASLLESISRRSLNYH